MARKKVITDDDVKALEAELEKKKSALADMREKLNMSRIDNFKAWCKRNCIDPMQFLKLAIAEEYGSEVKALYSRMIAEPVGVIKPTKLEAVKIEEEKAFHAPVTIEHSESEGDDNQDEENIDSDDETEDIDDDDNLSDSGQQKLWN